MTEDIIGRHFSLPLEETAEHQGKDTFLGPKMSSGGCVSWHRAAIYCPTGGKLPLRAFQDCSQLATRRRSSSPSKQRQFPNEGRRFFHQREKIHPWLRGCDQSRGRT